MTHGAFLVSQVFDLYPFRFLLQNRPEFSTANLVRQSALPVLAVIHFHTGIELQVRAVGGRPRNDEV